MLAMFAFFSSLSFALSAFALTRTFGPMPVEFEVFGASPAVAWSDLQTIALVIAVGLVARFAPRNGRVVVCPRALALAQIVFALAPAIVARIAPAGAYAGASIDAIVLRGLLLAPLAFTFGQSTRRVLLHAGVPKLARLPEWGAIVAGLALGAAAWLCLESRVGASTIAFAAPVVLLVRFVLPQLDRADMPEPEPYAGGVRCLPSLVGGLLLAYSVAATLGIEAGFGEFDAFAAWQCAGLGVAAIAFARWRGKVRRSGLVLGSMAFVALTLAAYANSSHERFDGLPHRIVQAACLGVGLALLARFYFGLPRARKVLKQIPAHQRRTPTGAPARVAVLFVGLTIGAWAGVPAAQGDPVVDWTLTVGAIGAGLLVFFDPRAGIARRVTWLVLGGTAFAIAASI